MESVSNPKISIVLPCYNGASMLPRAIDSCISQIFTDWELIIVNDCSIDDTLKVATDYSKRDSRIRVVSNEKNLKLPATLNHGFRLARGTYYTWTSDDNIMHPDMLQVLSDYLDVHDDIALVASDFVNADETGKEKDICRFEGDLNVLIPLNDYVGFSFMYRADVAKTIGEYDESLFLVEDYEYWLRIWKDHKIVRIDDVLYTRCMHDKSLTATRKNDIAARLLDLRLMYLDVFEERLRRYPKQRAILYNRIVDQLHGSKKRHYLFHFGKKQPFSFLARYLLVHYPNSMLKKLLKKE
ncbi:MAG: glycosyltransferase family 2 protein [Bacteroidaceae bacterium]|nr:glycosyltransferase family 2 protein [Bacteroidaceae bacterium]